MPRGRRPSKQTFDIKLLDAESLGSPGGFEAALRSIESVCFQAGPAIAGMVTALSSHSHVLEYIFSGRLRVLAVICEFRGLIILHPSIGRRRIREVVQMDHLRVSHTRNPKHNQYSQHEASPETFLFIFLRGVPVRRRHPLRPSRVLE